MRHIQSFQNENAIKEALDNNLLGKPYVALNQDTGTIDWNSKDFYSSSYFTIEAISSGVVHYYTTGGNMQFSVDDGDTWTTSSDININVQPGDKVLFKGTNDVLNGSFYTTTATFNVYGNIMSLLYGDNFIGQTRLIADYTFVGLFVLTNVTDASNLILPATTLTPNCYASMFASCTSLTTAPALPATTLADGCYSSMFEGCTSLTTAPELPATTLEFDCYVRMFNGCTALITAPSVLPATTLAEECYAIMFSGCTSLTTAPELPATALTIGCYYQMFGGCTALTTAPALPATTLEENCYREMFSGCTSLNYIKCLATSTGAMGCTDRWVSNVSSAGTFVKESSMTGWDTGVNGIPANWTVVDDV